MTWIAVAVVGGSLVGGYVQSKAAGKAADVQAATSQQGMQVQQQQFDVLQKNLQPYMQAGQSALAGQQALLGLSGQQQQADAIAQLAQSPQMLAMQQQGESAILQNAAATGGLRGGNVQAALGQFRPQLLNQLIQQQFGNLGGLTNLGQSSSAGVGNAGMNMASNIGNLLQQQGAAQAGGIMGRANAISGSLQNAAGAFMGGKSIGVF